MSISTSTIKVLIVEDEVLVAQDIMDMLEDAGYTVVGHAIDAPNALELFEDTLPDVVLMDVQLQGKTDGIEVATMFNDIRRVPIIYLTAQADTKSVSRAKATQPSAYLLKPFDERGLLIAMDIAISNFSAQESAAHPITEQAAAVVQVMATKERLNAEAILSVNDFLFIKQNYRFVKFQRQELLYIEADGSYSYLYTTLGKLVLRLSLTQTLEKLADSDLVRVHRSFAVKVGAIENFSDNEVTIGEQNIPIGSAYKETFLKAFTVL